MNDEEVITESTSLQADGLACVECEADYLQIRVPHVSVGRSVTGSQVFACVDCCPPDARRYGAVRVVHATSHDQLAADPVSTDWNTAVGGAEVGQ